MVYLIQYGKNHNRYIWNANNLWYDQRPFTKNINGWSTWPDLPHVGIWRTPIRNLRRYIEQLWKPSWTPVEDPCTPINPVGDGTMGTLITHIIDRFAMSRQRNLAHIWDQRGCLCPHTFIHTFTHSYDPQTPYWSWCGLLIYKVSLKLLSGARRGRT